MKTYHETLSGSIIYSIGDTHGCGHKILGFAQKLEEKAKNSGESQISIVLLGDLFDAFSFPEDPTDAHLKSEIDRRRHLYPELDEALQNREIIDWERNAGLRQICHVDTFLSTTDHEGIVALYQATKCFETFKLLYEKQQHDTSRFVILLGNHDADLLRGCCRYGRAQKYIHLCLLGFSPDEVIHHMTEGTPDVILRHPWLSWLNDRPHIARTADTVYMHGGPTYKESEKLFSEYHSDKSAYHHWISSLDEARQNGYMDPRLKENQCFLSPDCLFDKEKHCLPETEENDWVHHPSIITHFCEAADCQYLAIGHSPFIDFPKSEYLDLSRPEIQPLFRTPAQLPPNGMIIKHDNNMKREGELWACRHIVGSSEWTGIRATDMAEIPLRKG